MIRRTATVLALALAAACGPEEDPASIWARITRGRWAVVCEDPEGGGIVFAMTMDMPNNCSAVLDYQEVYGTCTIEPLDP